MTFDTRSYNSESEEDTLNNEVRYLKKDIRKEKEVASTYSSLMSKIKNKDSDEYQDAAAKREESNKKIKDMEMRKRGIESRLKQIRKGKSILRKSLDLVARAAEKIADDVKYVAKKGGKAVKKAGSSIKRNSIKLKNKIADSADKAGTKIARRMSINPDEE